MVRSVGSNLVTGLRDLAYQPGCPISDPSQNEEGGGCVVLGEKVE
jgi:hypothetical protein